jgi:hypothetical protein
MSTPNPILVAAAPSLIAVLNAIKAFNLNIGADPTKWALTVPGALTILVGTVQLQLPEVAQAEAGLLQTDVNTKIDGWIASLQAKT